MEFLINIDSCKQEHLEIRIQGALSPFSVSNSANYTPINIISTVASNFPNNAFNSNTIHSTNTTENLHPYSTSQFVLIKDKSNPRSKCAVSVSSDSELSNNKMITSTKPLNSVQSDANYPITEPLPLPVDISTSCTSNSPVLSPVPIDINFDSQPLILSSQLSTEPGSNLSPENELKKVSSTSKRKRKSDNDAASNRKQKGIWQIDEIFKSSSTTIPSHDSPTRNASICVSPSVMVGNTGLLSPIHNFYTASNSSYSNCELSPREISMQTDLSMSHIYALQKSHDALLSKSSETTLLEEFRMKLEEREQEFRKLGRKLEKLKECEERNRTMMKSLLIQHSGLERKTIRQKVMKNRLSLGQFVTHRHVAHFEEKWVEGWKFQKLDKRRKAIDDAKEKIEKKRRQWNKRKPNNGDKNKKSKSVEATVAEFFEQAEIFEVRKQMLNKEDKEIAVELEQLDRERSLHIKEIKRIANEDASVFKEHPILNKRYLMLNLLGKGGFSQVHKGYDLQEQRYVACKIHTLNPAWPMEKKDTYFRHASREIEILKTLNHSRIVKVYDAFDINMDSFCNVVEYCEGSDIDFYLQQNKFLPEREAKSIICQVVSALKYLNERRPPVVHYNLKPGNILLASGPAADEIKVTDFGLRKLMSDKYNTDMDDLTSQEDYDATYCYLPPECFETGKEAREISSKVDVWSVGVIFYEQLFGKKPFVQLQSYLSQSDILQQNTIILQANTIQFPNHPKVSDGAKDFIKRCVTYHKENRPNVFQLANDDYLKPKAQLRALNVCLSRKLEVRTI